MAIEMIAFESTLISNTLIVKITCIEGREKLCGFQIFVALALSASVIFWSTKTGQNQTACYCYD